jgi:hypothetical protein
MLEFHSEYTKKFNFDIPLEKKCLAQLIHPHLGYLSNFKVNRINSILKKNKNLNLLSFKFVFFFNKIFFFI